MRLGTYAVRGTIGPDKSEPVNVTIVKMPLGTGPEFRAYFTFRDVEYAYRPRKMSPHPERLKPAHVPTSVQPTATSIAHEAFKAAKEAAAEDARQAEIAARDAEQDGLSLDEIVMGAVGRRSMGVPQ